MKYELIKTYPGSPKLNTIINFGDIDCDFTHNPESYPEFWELVVEKDYEILSYSDNNNNIFREKDNQGILHRLDFKIHSVKRLSDGEIFTIGDKVFSEYVNYTINKIDIVNDKCMVTALYDTNNSNGSRLHYNLNNLKKSKQPLFTTEDGVDIFEGDKYSVIDLLENEYRSTHNTTITGSKSARYILISTKEKAEEYVLYNKPLLTLKDIDELLCKNTSSYFLEKFKKRAQKLNNNN